MLTAISPDQMHVIELIFNYFYNHFIVNVYVMAKDFNVENKATVYSYHLYTNSCDRIEIIENVVNDNGIYDHKKDRFYFPKKPKNFNKCPLYASILKGSKTAKIIRNDNGTITDLVGFEANLIDLIANELNFTWKIIEMNNFDEKQSSFLHLVITLFLFLIKNFGKKLDHIDF